MKRPSKGSKRASKIRDDEEWVNVDSIIRRTQEDGANNSNRRRRNTRSNSLDSSGEDSVEEIAENVDSSEESDLELQFINVPKQVKPFENVLCPTASTSNPHSLWFYSRIFSSDMYNNLEKHFDAFNGTYLSKAILGEIFHEKMTDLSVDYDANITFEGIKVTTISNLFSCGTKKRLELKGISLKTADNKNESADQRKRILLVHDCLAELLHATLKVGDILIIFSNGSWVLDSPVIPLNARMQNSLIGHYRHNRIFEAAESNEIDDDIDDDFRSRIDSSKFNIVYQEHEDENEMVVKITPVISIDPDVNNNSEPEGNNQNLMVQPTSSPLPHSVSSNSSVVSTPSPTKFPGPVPNINLNSSNRLKRNEVATNAANENAGDKITCILNGMEEINGHASVSSSTQDQALKSPVQLPSASTQKRKRNSSVESIETTEPTSKKKKVQTPSTTNNNTTTTTTTTTKTSTSTISDNDRVENNRPSSSTTKSATKVTVKDVLDEETKMLEILGSDDEESENSPEVIKEHDNVEHTDRATTDNNNHDEEEKGHQQEDSVLNPYEGMPLHTQIFNDTTSQTFTTSREAGSSVNVVDDEKKKESPRNKSSPATKTKDNSDEDSDSSSTDDHDNIMISYAPSDGSESCMEEDSGSGAESFKSAFSTKIPSPEKNKAEEENVERLSPHVKDCRVLVQKLKTSDVEACRLSNLSISLLKMQSSPLKLNQSNIASSSSNSSVIHRINTPRRSSRNTSNNHMQSPAKSSSLTKASPKNKK